MVEFHSFLLHGRVVLISEHTPKHTESLMPICQPCSSQEGGQGRHLSRGLSLTVCAFHQNLSKQDMRELNLSDGRADDGHEHVREMRSEANHLETSSPVYLSAQPSLCNPKKLVRGLRVVFEMLNYILLLICVFLCVVYMNYLYTYMYVCTGMNICVSCMYI